MGALLIMLGAEYLKVEQAHRTVRLALFGVGSTTAPEAAPPAVRLLDGPREFHRFMLTSATPGMDDQQLAWMRRVVGRHAMPPALMRWALAAGLNGRASESVHTLRLLCAMHSPERCDEGRAGWAVARQTWKQLPEFPADAGASCCASQKRKP